MTTSRCLKGLATSVLICLSAFGCGQARVAVPPTDAFRVIDSDPTRLVTPTQLFSSNVLEVWDFGVDEDRAGWEVRDLTLVDELDVGPVYRSLSSDPKMIKEVDLDAHQVDSIEIDISGDTGRDVRLFWAGHNQAFERGRSVEWNGPFTGSTVQFQLDGNPSWDGRITKIRIDPTSLKGVDFAIGEIRVLQKSELAAGEDRDGNRTFKLDLDGDTRNAIAVTAGSELNHTVTVTKGARLRFSLAWIHAQSQPVNCIVSLRQDGREFQVFEESIDAGDAEGAAVWHDREVELDNFVPGDADLRFEVKPVNAAGPATAMVFWANPEIYVERRRAVANNVVLVSIDTLRSLNMSVYGYPRETTPFLASWTAADAAAFSNVIATSPWTKPSHTSLLTGIGSLTHGVNFDAGIPLEYELVSETFRDAGYRTFAVTGGVYVRPDEGFAQGFDSFEYWKDVDNEGELRWGMERFLRHIDQARSGGRPFFGFFHTYEVHAPYRARQPYFAQFAAELGDSSPTSPEFTTRKDPPDEGYGFKVRQRVVDKGASGRGGVQAVAGNRLPEVIAAYDSSIALVDQNIRMLIEFLEQTDLYENTIVVVTADHGEAFGEHGVFGHTSLYDEVLRVPLIVYGPQLVSGGARIANQISLVDVAPTLLELCGIDGPTGVDGQSVVGLLENQHTSDDRDAWSYAGSTNYGVSLRTGNAYKVMFPYSVWNEGTTSSPVVFDLRDNSSELAPSSSSTQGIRPLREYVQSHLRDRKTGIRITAANSADRAFAFSLKGADIRVNRLKSSDMACDCARWMGPRGAAFTVPPGVSFDVIVDGYMGGDISCELSWPSANITPKHLTLTSTNMSPKLELEWTGSQWLSTEGETPSTAVFNVVLESMSVADQGGAVVDRRLEDQLKALGYVEDDTPTSRENQR